MIDPGVGSSYLVETWVLSVACVTVLASIILYLWVPKKGSVYASLVVYLLLGFSSGALIATTGVLSSPFIALWMFPAVFAGIFGLWGILPSLLSASVIIAKNYLENILSAEMLVVIAFVGILPVITSFILWRHQNGQFGGSDEKQAYKNLASELSEVATKSEVVINAIGDGVMAVDAQGIIQLINPAAQTILGWSKQDAMTLNYKSVLQLLDQQNNPLTDQTNPVQQALNTNQQIRNNDLSISTKSGKKIMTALVVSPIGEVGSGAIIVFRDVTKERAEEREQAEFISTASHEMRTPVASIEGFLGLALNPTTAQIDDRAKSYIMKAHEAAQHLGHLFQDLLDVTKADDRRMSNNPRVVDIVQFTRDIVTGFTQKASDKGLRLVYKPIPDDGGKHIVPAYHINLDNDHVREILDNLVENGIKYTPAGEVVIDVQASEDKVIVSIADSGIGIPSEDIPHLFQKFYRVSNEETNQIGGTGLGLYLCRKLAESLDGRIWVESQYKKGSTFYLELPRISSQEAVQIASQQALRPQVDAVSTPDIPAPASIPQSATPIAPLTTTPAPGIDVVRPATTVPRGQTLSREQIAAQVARLKQLSQEQSSPTTGEGQ